MRLFRPSWHLNTRPPQKVICVCVGGHVRSRPAKIKHDMVDMRRAGVADDEDEVGVFTGVFLRRAAGNKHHLSVRATGLTSAQFTVFLTVPDPAL